MRCDGILELAKECMVQCLHTCAPRKSFLSDKSTPKIAFS